MTKKQSKKEFTEREINNVLKDGFFTEEELEEALEDNDFGKSKMKAIKLNMDNLEDRLLFIYLEKKNITDVIKKSLKVYKMHFDEEVLFTEKLNNLVKAKSPVESVVIPPHEEPEELDSDDLASFI